MKSKNLVLVIVLVVATLVLLSTGVNASGSPLILSASNVNTVNNTANSTVNNTVNNTAVNNTIVNNAVSNNVVAVNNVDAEKDIPKTGESDVYVIMAI